MRFGRGIKIVPEKLKLKKRRLKGEKQELEKKGVKKIVSRG